MTAPQKKQHEFPLLWDMDDPAYVKMWIEAMIRRGETDGLFTVKVETTPALVAELLVRNSHNRPLSKARVKEWEKTLLEGRYMLSSQGISVNTNGQLNNGQHRLSAIKNVGARVEILIAFGEHLKAFQVLDRQHTRSGSDTLALMNEKNTISIAAALRLVYNIEQGRPSATGKLSNDVIGDYLNETHPRMRDAGAPGSRASDNVVNLTPASATAAYYMILSQTDHPGRLDEFWEKFCTGAGISNPKDAILALRRRLAAKKYKNHETVASIILGWNAWLKTSRSANLHWTVDKDFPQVI